VHRPRAVLAAPAPPTGPPELLYVLPTKLIAALMTIQASGERIPLAFDDYP
jgi:hypothetical protein